MLEPHIYTHLICTLCVCACAYVRVHACVHMCACMHAWSWYYGETGHQITDVQGRLRANVGYRPLLLCMHKILGKSVVSET